MRPENSVEKLNEARLRIYEKRGDWLLSIREGILTVDDLILHAQTPDGRDLWKMPLEQVLTAPPGSTISGARKTITIMRRILGIRTKDVLTVGWLVDVRSQGSRINAYVEATTPKQLWAGFPFTPMRERTR
jgi:hypothetical protein